MGSKKQGQAIQALEQKVAGNPRSRAFSRLADLHRQNGNLQAAINMCAAGIAEHPRYVTGRLVLGRCYKQQGDLPAAVEELTQVCEIDARNAAALRMLAEIFMAQGHPDAAGGLYAILSEMEPDNHEMRARAAKNKLRMKGCAADILAAVKAAGLAGAAAGAMPIAGGPTAPAQPAASAPTAPPRADATAPPPELTGSDVENRIDAMFGGQAAPAEAPPAESVLDHPSGDDIANQLDEIYGGGTASAPPAESVPDQPGGEVVDQLDELFGGQTISAPPAESVLDHPSGDDIANQLDAIYGGGAASAPPAEAVPDQQPSGGVVDQLDELFGGQTLSALEPSAGSESLMPMEMGAGEGAVVDQLDELFGGRSLPAIGPMPEESVAAAPAEEPDFPDITDEIDIAESTEAAEAAAAPSGRGDGMEEQLRALFGAPEQGIGGNGEAVLIFGSGDNSVVLPAPASAARPEPDATDALPAAEADGSITDALPAAEADGSITDALPVAEADGSITDALPVAEVEGSITDALPIAEVEEGAADGLPELVVDAEAVAELPPDPEAIADELEPRMPVIVDANGEDIAAPPEANEVDERLNALFGGAGPEEDGVKDELIAEDEPAANIDIDALADAIDAEIEASGAVIDGYNEVSGVDIDIDSAAVSVSADAEESTSSVIDTSASDDVSGIDIDALAKAVSADAEESTSSVIDIGASDDALGIDIDALAGAIDAEIEASGAVIDECNEINDIDIDSAAVSVSADAEESTGSVIDTSASGDVSGIDIDALAKAVSADAEESTSGVIDTSGEALGVDVDIDIDPAVVAVGSAEAESTSGVDIDIDIDPAVVAVGSAEAESTGVVIDASASDDVIGDGAGADDLEARLSELFNEGLYVDTDSQLADGASAVEVGVEVTDEVDAGDIISVEDEPALVAADVAAAEEGGGSITSMISKIDVIESEEVPSAPPSESSADDVQEKIRQLFRSEGDAPKTLDIGLGGDGSSALTPDERDTPFDLPDHVLSPTLADIYYQQGQPELALHIYERLARRDASNERLAEKIEEIRGVLQTGGGGAEPPCKADTQEKARTASSGRKKKGGGAKEELDIRPLAGVRIKKSAPAKKSKRAKKS